MDIVEMAVIKVTAFMLAVGKIAARAIVVLIMIAVPVQEYSYQHQHR
jgi:hypothetical protein